MHQLSFAYCNTYILSVNICDIFRLRLIYSTVVIIEPTQLKARLLLSAFFISFDITISLRYFRTIRKCGSHILTPPHTFTSPTVCESPSLTRYRFPIYDLCSVLKGHTLDELSTIKTGP